MLTTRALLSLTSTVWLALSQAAFATGPQDIAPHVRGVWIPNSHSSFFATRDTVTDQMEILATAGINVVFPVVWSKGYTLFDSDVAERVTGSRVDPRYGERDPLAEVLFEGHRLGIEVIPWFEYGFAAGHETYPGKILDRQPGWAAIGADGRPLVKNGFLWMNSLDPNVQAFMTSLVVECATRYDVDGVQGDDRLPALPAEGGYDAATVARYETEHGFAPPSDVHDPAWVQWRADRLTDYLARLREAVKGVRPGLVLSMAPGGPSWSLRDYCQDQRAWLERGLVDALHPQLYARTLETYAQQADDMLSIDWLGQQPEVIAPGVLLSFRDYFANEAFAVGAVAANQERALAGEVWFYERGFVVQEGALARRLRATAYQRTAPLPWRAAPGWRPEALQGQSVARGEPAGEPAGGPAGGPRRAFLTASVTGPYRIYTRPIDGTGAWTERETVGLVAGAQSMVHQAPIAEPAFEVLGLIDRR